MQLEKTSPKRAGGLSNGNLSVIMGAEVNSVKIDYALAGNRERWLRHPVLGDPSFDTFERVGKPVHISEPPYEWAVNGSLYRDFDDTWYCYCGLYHRGYAGGGGLDASRFVIYRSKDRGASWEYLGFGFEKGFRMDGSDRDWDGCPDVVLCYDERSGKYLLAYDTGTNDSGWDNAFSDSNDGPDAGGAIAWADTPAGPFRRIGSLVFSNNHVIGTMGRWRRLYAMTVYPREHDYVAFALNDADDCYTWGLSIMTAPSPEGPWSEPRQLLCCDRPDFYPCPCEYHPVDLIDGVCYAHATSVAMNRDYQFVFTAPLARAHDPSAWKLAADGSVWHSRPLPEEHEGIWGQTYNGFVEPDTGRYVVMFPSKTADDLGTINIAARPWNRPYSDGFTIAAHKGPSVTRTRAAYGDFILDAEFTVLGQADLAFACRGTLGADDSVSDSVPCEDALRNYAAVRLTERGCALITVGADGRTAVHASLETETGAPASLHVECRNGCIRASCGGRFVGEMTVDAAPAQLGLVLAPYSSFACTRFLLDGDPCRWTERWNVFDGLLGAGQRHPAKKIAAVDAPLEQGRWSRTADGVVGEGRVALKWNVVCDAFTVHAPRAEGLGEMGIWLDGFFVGSRILSQERSAFTMTGLEYGRHAIRVEPLHGRIAVDGLTVSGAPENL